MSFISAAAIAAIFAISSRFIAFFPGEWHHADFGASSFFRPFFAFSIFYNFFCLILLIFTIDTTHPLDT